MESRTVQAIEKGVNVAHVIRDLVATVVRNTFPCEAH